MPEIPRTKFNSPWTVENIEAALNDVSSAKGSSESLTAALNAMRAEINSLSGGVHLKGAVDYYSDLPANPSEGDAYTVRYQGTSGTDPLGIEYAWATYQGTPQWIPIGVDPSVFAKLTADETALGEVINGGAAGTKNLAPISTIQKETTTAHYTSIIPCYFKAGTYHIKFGYTTGQVATFVLRNKEGTTLLNLPANIPKGTGTYNADFTISADCYGYHIYGENTAELTDIMICRKTLYDANPEFEPYAPAKTNVEITPALVEIVDGGAKNLFNMSGAQTFDITGYGIHCTINMLTGVITLDGVNQDKKCTGSFNIKIADSTALGLQSGVVYKLNCDGYTTSDTTIGIYVYTSGATPETQFDTYSHTELAWNTAWEQSNGFRLFIRSGTVVNNITLRPMICTSAAWKISKQYQPFLPSWQEMWDAIQALQSGGNRALTMQTEPEEQEER